MTVSTSEFESLPSMIGVAAVRPGGFGQQQSASNGGKNLPHSGAKRPPSAAAARAAAKSVNRWLQHEQPSIRLVIEQESGETMIHVVDVASGATIRQIPHAEVIKLAKWWAEHSLLRDEELTGLAINERA